MKTLCVGYLIALTVLLVTSQPLAFVPRQSELHMLVHAVGPVSHLSSFAILALLAWAAQWPLPQWGIVAFLVSYGMGTELGQHFVPHRTPELADFLQNVVGIVIGGGAYWLAVRAWRHVGLRGNDRQRILR